MANIFFPTVSFINLPFVNENTFIVEHNLGQYPLVNILSFTEGTTFGSAWNLFVYNGTTWADRPDVGTVLPYDVVIIEHLDVNSFGVTFADFLVRSGFVALTV